MFGLLHGSIDKYSGICLTISYDKIKFDIFFKTFRQIIGNMIKNEKFHILRIENLVTYNLE